MNCVTAVSNTKSNGSDWKAIKSLINSIKLLKVYIWTVNDNDWKTIINYNIAIIDADLYNEENNTRY